MRKLFVDLDGVLADFDEQHLRKLGVRSSKDLDDVDWDAVRRVPGFYATMPPMADMRELWRSCRPYDPIVLTGVPSSIASAEEEKRAWVREHLGDDVPVICCRSRDKFLFGHDGDVLVDDWTKYRHLWESMGGTFVLHVDAESTIPRLYAAMR